MRIALLVLGAVQLALGGLMALAPGTFFVEVGPYGARNDHYIRDMASWKLALAAVAFVAVRHAAWRVPVLAFALVHYGLHALNHVLDVGEADPGWLGSANLASLVAGAAILALLLRRARAGPGAAE